MKQRLLALGLSALSLVGGHFYNRRWDRAVLFFLALLLWGIGGYVNFAMGLPGPGGAVIGEELAAIAASHWTAFAFGCLILWAVSLIVTYKDAGRAGEPVGWTESGIIGAIGLSLLTGVFLLILLVGWSTIRFLPGSENPAQAEPASLAVPSRSFSHHVYLGRADAPGALQEPPSGDGVLRGRFVHQGKPAVGVTLSLVLNGKYETPQLTTDDRGEFGVRLPRGEWYVNRLVTHAWSEKPEEGEFVIVTGQEPKLVAGRYNRHYWLERQGARIEVSNASQEPQLTFTIRKPVALSWPRPGEQGVRTTVDEGVVAWQAYPGAQTYLVRVTELVREGSTISYHDVTARAVGGDTRFALAQLQALPSENGEKEYQVSVLAFGQDGQLLSETNERFAGHSFVLADSKQFIRESDRMPGSDRFSTEELAQMRDNNQRIEAAAVLLKNGLPAEAERLLAKVRGKTDPGKKAAIAGYLLAVRGRCAEANRLFAKARSEGGQACVPSYYRAGCGEPRSAAAGH